MSGTLAGLRFGEPRALLGLLLLVVIALWLARRGRGALRFSSQALFDGAPVTFAQRLAGWLARGRWLALGLLVIALARPQRGLEEHRLRADGIAIVMAIDRSGSMRALDFEQDGQRQDRLTVVKQVFRDFVAGRDGLGGRPDDLIGLVSFGGWPEERCPLTLDHGALQDALAAVEIPEPWADARGRPVADELYQESVATAIGDALAMSVERAQAAPAKSKVVILLSDGENTAGVLDPVEAAEAARDLGVRVHTIGVGTTGRVPFPQRDRFGQVSYVAMDVQLDEKTLRAVAETTGGRYWNAQDRTALTHVYEQIDSLEKTAVEAGGYVEWRELYRWLLLPVGLLLLFESVLGATRLRTLP
ncbi:MAG: VWA domain-containing protein [Planctomycetes bacterium]|nr:VWA domain-containing protein [Planctomycetota bacterium]